MFIFLEIQNEPASLYSQALRANSLCFYRPLRDWLSRRFGDSSDSDNGFSSASSTPAKPTVEKLR